MGQNLRAQGGRYCGKVSLEASKWRDGLGGRRQQEGGRTEVFRGQRPAFCLF